MDDRKRAKILGQVDEYIWQFGADKFLADFEELYPAPYREIVGKSKEKKIPVLLTKYPRGR